MHAGDEGSQREQHHQIEACRIHVDERPHRGRVDQPHGGEERRPVHGLRPHQLDALLLGRRIAPADVNAKEAIDDRQNLPIQADGLAREGDKADAENGHRQHDDVGKVDLEHVDEEDIRRLRLDLLETLLERGHPGRLMIRRRLLVRFVCVATSGFGRIGHNVFLVENREWLEARREPASR